MSEEVAQTDEESGRDKLKKITAEKKKLRKQEKELRESLDANKEQRKDARKKVSRSKAEVFEKRANLAGCVRMINKLVLAKSIKQNLKEFKTISEKFFVDSSAFIEASNDHIEALEELAKYE